MSFIIMKNKITHNDIERANERIMNMTDDELKKFKNSEDYIKFTDEEFERAGRIAWKNYEKRKKRKKMWCWFLNLIKHN